MRALITLIIFGSSVSWAATQPNTLSVNCGCNPRIAVNSCGVNPAFMTKNKTDIARELGFDVPADNVRIYNKAKGYALYLGMADFLVKSDRARMFYPEYYTRSAKEVSMLTLQSKFTPKNVTETDEYLRCTIPSDKYCVYKNSLRPYLALASKTSGIDYSFLACQSYVESRFNRDAKSSVGAIGYSQIKPSNIKYLNEVLHLAIRRAGDRNIASATSSPRSIRIKKVQTDIARMWREFWSGTKKAPINLNKCDLTCYRQVFLAQAISLKTDMLALATSASGIKADFDDSGDFKIEGMDKGDSLLMLAGSYNLGVTKMIRLISKFCSGSNKLKDCLDKMKNGNLGNHILEENVRRDVASITNYILRIRDCSQQFSAERIDFDDDERWTETVRTEKQNQQRDQVVQCLLHPCAL